MVSPYYLSLAFVSRVAFAVCPAKGGAAPGTTSVRNGGNVPKFAANLTMMFTELPFLDRFGAAAKAGFQAVEFVSPYEHAAEAVAKCAKDAGVAVSLFNLPPGDWAAGERGMTCLPDREKEFRESVDVALHYAEQLGVTYLHAMGGIVPKGVDAAICRATLVNNLKYAAEKAAAQNITLLLEAINTRDMPGFIVSRQAECYAVCQEVGAKNLKMQLDCYHMQVMEGDLATKLKQYAPSCGYIQVAGCPERNEPNTGEIRYEYILPLIDSLGYTGWVGCEYRPAGATVDGLGWMKSMAKA
jgi:hydroxypyruvate isomerase